jgi:hypothetical protein
MEPAEPADDEGEIRVWLITLTDAADVLLRQAERHLDAEAQAAFAASQTSTVMLRQVERDRVRALRDRLHRFRTAADGGC